MDIAIQQGEFVTLTLSVRGTRAHQLQPRLATRRVRVRVIVHNVRVVVQRTFYVQRRDMDGDSQLEREDVFRHPPFALSKIEPEYLQHRHARKKLEVCDEHPRPPAQSISP